MNALSKSAEKIAVEFEYHLTADGKSNKTLESYVGDIRAFLQWVRKQGQFIHRKLKKIPCNKLQKLFSAGKL